MKVEQIEKLKKSLSLLSNLSVPVALTESITVPVYNAAFILDGVIKEIEQEQKTSSDSISVEPITELPTEDLNNEEN